MPFYSSVAEAIVEEGEGINEEMKRGREEREERKRENVQER